MIVKMKKVSLVVLDSHKQKSLDELKRLGVMHIQTQARTSDELQTLMDQKNRMEKAFYLLPADAPAEKAGNVQLPDAQEAMEYVLGLSEEMRNLRDGVEKLKREIQNLGPWGDYEPADILFLREKGISVNLYNCSPDILKKLPESGSRFILKKSKTQILFCEINADELHEQEIVPVPLPDRSLSSMEKEFAALEKRIQEIETSLKESGTRRSVIQKGIGILNGKIEFEQVRISMEIEEGDNLSYLTGYVPVPKVDLVKKGAEKEGWAILIQDPGEEDAVPTLVENRRPIGIIKPIFRFLDTNPGYREYDISFWFLLFFPIFFAIIIGDAGYGAIFFILSLVLAVKRRAFTNGVKLLMVLSVCTLAWGAVTGTWFGSEKLAQLRPLSIFIFKPIASGNPNSGEVVKWLCFIIGTTQLSIAHIQNFIKQMPSVKALSQLGWLSMVLGLYYLVLNLVIDPQKYPVPEYAVYMIGAGFIFVILFAQQEKGVNFFKGLIRGIGGLLTTFLDGIGAFSDIISYIRLFAVGLATVAIAQSFNSMAAGMMEGGAGIFGAAFILLFGHTLNLVMALLSVVVHGVRLNMLEFSGHLGMEWSGFKYEPFRVK